MTYRFVAKKRAFGCGVERGCAFAPDDASVSMSPKRETSSLLIAMLLLAGAAGCRQEAAVDKSPTPVRTAQVQVINAGTANTYSANIQPYQQVDLAFKSNGYLASIRQVKDADGHVRNIDIGDYVAQGTVLATVQQDEFKEKLAQAKASLERSQAENERAKLSYERIYETV